MKIFLILIVFFTILQAFTSEKEIQIGKEIFVLKTESYTEYANKGTSIHLYAKDINGSKVKALSFVLHYQFGSCVPESLEEGTYSIKKDRIVLYSHWQRFSNASAPVGDRIQVYKVDEKGALYLSESKVYIERHTPNDRTDDGMQYLSKKAKTRQETKLLLAYQKSVEALFKAKFVMGKEAESLRMEVKNALALRQKQRWQ